MSARDASGRQAIGDLLRLVFLLRGLRTQLYAYERYFCGLSYLTRDSMEGLVAPEKPLIFEYVRLIGD